MCACYEVDIVVIDEIWGSIASALLMCKRDVAVFCY